MVKQFLRYMKMTIYLKLNFNYLSKMTKYLKRKFVPISWIILKEKINLKKSCFFYFKMYICREMVMSERLISSCWNPFIMDFHLWVLWSFKFEVQYGLKSLVNLNLENLRVIISSAVGVFSERLTESSLLQFFL